MMTFSLIVTVRETLFQILCRESCNLGRIHSTVFTGKLPVLRKS